MFPPKGNCSFSNRTVVVVVVVSKAVVGSVVVVDVFAVGGTYCLRTGALAYLASLSGA